MSKRIALGKIAAPHGVKGLVKITPYGDDPGLLETCPTTFSHNGRHNGGKAFTITLKNSMGKYILAEIESITTREDAEALKGVEIFTTRDALPEIEDEDSYYHEDLIGMKALDTEGKEIGIVQAVHNFGAGDLLEIRLSEGQSFMIPFTRETVADMNDGAITFANYAEYLG